MVVSTRLVSVTSHVYDEPPTISVAERKVMSVLHGVDFLIEWVLRVDFQNECVALGGISEQIRGIGWTFEMNAEHGVDLWYDGCLTFGVIFRIFSVQFNFYSMSTSDWERLMTSLRRLCSILASNNSDKHRLSPDRVQAASPDTLHSCTPRRGLAVDEPAVVCTHLPGRVHILLQRHIQHEQRYVYPRYVYQCTQSLNVVFEAVLHYHYMSSMS